MREAPALAGATRPRPRPAAAPRGKTPPRRGAAPSSLLGRAFARPGVTIAGAAFAALMTGIVANAIFFQKGHHPAPLFNANPPASPASPPQPPSRAEIAPAPAMPAPPPAAALAPAADPAPPAATPVASAPVASPGHRVPVASRPAPRPAQPSHKAATHAHADSIGDLIGTLGRKPAAAKPAAGVAPSGHSHGTDGKPRPRLVKDIPAPQG